MGREPLQQPVFYPTGKGFDAKCGQSISHMKKPLSFASGELGAMRSIMAAVAASTLLFACHPHDDDDDPGPQFQAARNMLYVTTNAMANEVIAYQRDSVTGALTQMGSYLTGGQGFINPTANKLGPNDADMALTVDDDHRRLFAVNGGSNNISVFDIHSDGSLTSVSGSPFPSGGRQPVSVGVYGHDLYVVNKNEDTLQLPNKEMPNYTKFHIGSGGYLTQVMGATRNTLSHASPSQALVSRNGDLVFGADFLVPMFHPGAGSLRSFMAEGLVNAPGSPLVVPGDPMTALPLGLWEHPSEHILYVGLPARSKLAVFTFSGAGSLNYVTEANNSGAAICWVRSNHAGDQIYTLNSLSNSVSYYKANDPMNPVEMQHFLLSEPGPMFTNVQGMSQVTSGPFFEELSPDERFLYTVNQREDYFSPSQSGNNIHVLSIAPDGTLTEPLPVTGVPTAATNRPVGLVVL
jgi:6-phosphogluconolactonase (cycloisomerase 2 family)